MSITRTAIRILLPAAFLAVSTSWAQAPATPPSFVASPEIYKVIAENDKYRVIEVVWKPGQRDRVHSHPEAATYYLSDCVLRNHPSGGPPQDGTRLAGRASVRGPIAAHSIENIGSADCRLIMFEPK
jgi:beta-alanine degradation protein BauB